MKADNNKALLKRRANFKQNIPLVLMSAPCLIWLLMFHYAPMFGLTLAFKDYTYRNGIFGSKWIGLENFKYIFSSGEVIGVLGRTVMYHILFTAAITVLSILIALFLYNIRSKRAQRFFQKTITMPYMISMAVLGYIVYMFLNFDSGFVNNLLSDLGGDRISWYTEAGYWPVILTIVNTWFGAGIKSIYYYAALMSVDESLFEAAELDGANKVRQAIHISLPAIMPMVCIFLIRDMGNILSSNFGLFYSVTMDSSALYSTTDVLSTYLFRGLMGGSISISVALSLFSSVVTVAGTLGVNAIVKKLSPENSLF